MHHEILRGATDLLPDFGIQTACGRRLHDLLMPTLDRAIPLPQVLYAAVLVGKDLHLDVARIADELLDVDVPTSERFARFPTCHVEYAPEFLGVPRHAHPPTAASRDGLHHDGVPGVGYEGDCVLVAHGFGGAGDDGKACALGQLPRAQLVAEVVELLRGRADEHDALLLAPTREVCVLSQEAVSRIDGVDVLLNRQRHDAVDVEIGLDRPELRREQVRLIGLVSVERKRVLVAVHRHGPLAQFGARPECANRDLAAVGDHDSREIVNRRSGGQGVPPQGLPG